MFSLQLISNNIKINFSINNFLNVLQLENSKWWKNKRWLIHLFLWSFLINGLIIYTYISGLSSEFAGLSIDPFKPFLSTFTLNELFQADLYIAISLFFGLSSIIIQIGIIILLQNTIITEVENGSLIWLMSNPVSRSEIILAKFFSNILNLTIFANIIPLLVLNLIIYAKTGILIPLNLFIIPSILILLLSTFYVSLLLLLGVIFESRAMVLVVSFGITQVSGIINFIKPLYDLVISFLPVTFGVQSELYILTGELSNLVPVFWTSFFSIFFLNITIKLFQIKEF